MKTAIFVEGQTELVFVREMLLKVFEYQNIGLKCLEMRGGDVHNVPYAFPDSNSAPNAPYYFQIMNVGGDVNVLSVILKRETRLWNQNFDKIIGLRDMFSDDYKKATGHQGLNEEINQKFINGHQKTIDDKAIHPEKISFHFAIMEVEEWILASYQIFQKMDEQLTPLFIEEKLGFNLENIDPETHFFHPTKELKAIYELTDSSYNKSRDIVNKISGYFEKEDYQQLNTSDKCTSFSHFYTASFPKQIRS